AIKWFDISKVSKAPARFDLKKLLQINREHIKMIKDDELNKILDLNKDLAQLAKFYTQETSTIKELKEKMQAIFNAKDFGEFETEYKILKELLKDIELFENYEDFKN
ncbi:TPA: glutamate--tRNA ligase, partial [Campylobacter jejuni]|nr:glutamate--tRNA ligase [Campylobacter jejuni]